MRKVALFISLVLDDDRATRDGLLFGRFGGLGQTGLHLGIAQTLQVQFPVVVLTAKRSVIGQFISCLSCK